MPLNSPEILSTKQSIGHGFFFKPHKTGYTYRLAANRHPRQPRFWCIWVHRCGPGGAPDETQRAWLSEETITRDDMAEAIGSIREDLSGWIGNCGKQLQKWLAEEAPSPKGF